MKEHRLNDGAVSEPFHCFEDLIEMQSGIGPINPFNVFLIYGVKLQLSVVDLEKRVKNGLTRDKEGVCQDRDLRLRAILITELQNVIHDFRKFRVTGRFAVPGEGQRIGELPLGFHFLELFPEHRTDEPPARHLLMRTRVGIEADLAVNAVEGADLAVPRADIDTERNAETAAVNGAENG